MKNIGSCRFIWSINRILARLSVGAVDYESFVGLRVDMESGKKGTVVFMKARVIEEVIGSWL
jgi:hypothetical protein